MPEREAVSLGSLLQRAKRKDGEGEGGRKEDEVEKRGKTETAVSDL